MRILILTSIILAGCIRNGCHVEYAKIKTIGKHHNWTDTYGVLLENGETRQVQAPVVGQSVPYSKCFEPSAPEGEGS